MEVGRRWGQVGSPRAAARLFALVAVVFVLASCSLLGTGPSSGSSGSAEPSPVLARQTYTGLPDFTAVHAEGPILVTLRPADIATVEVTSTGVDLGTIVVAADGGTLNLGIVPGVDWAELGQVEAQVSLPSLRSVQLDGTARGRSGDTLRLDRLILDLAGGSTFSAVLDVDGGVIAELSGGAQLDLDGRAASFEATLSGGSVADTEGLETANVRVAASGKSSASVQVSGELSVRAVGGSTVRYSGQAIIESQTIDATSTLVAPK